MPTSTYYNHVYVIAFDVKSRSEDGSDVTSNMIRAALLRRVVHTPPDELFAAADGPYETDQEDKILHEPIIPIMLEADD